jgi:hypothetical protein
MPQTLILRRSAIPNNKPTTAKLALGEIAINTYDGKIFFHKSGSTGESVEEALTTNAFNIGSLTISGSLHTLIGTTSISGSSTIYSPSGSASKYFLVKNDTQDLFQVNQEGVMQVASFDTLPTAVPGGIVMSSSGEYYIFMP